MYCRCLPPYLPLYCHRTAAALPLCTSQDYANWELLIVGDDCPELDDFMEQHKQAILGAMC